MIKKQLPAGTKVILIIPDQGTFGGEKKLEHVTKSEQVIYLTEKGKELIHKTKPEPEKQKRKKHEKKRVKQSEPKKQQSPGGFIIAVTCFVGLIVWLVMQSGAIR